MSTRSSLAFRCLTCSAWLLLSAWTAAAQSAGAAPATPTSESETPAPAPAAKPEAKSDAKSEQAQPAANEDGFRMGAFTFKPGGRVKLDVIRDFKPIGSEDSFDPRTIPIDGSEGTNSNLHAKETRLSLDIRGDVEGKQLRMYVETDFYGSSSVLRLRQAYGSYGGLLAGQTWSTFVDEDNMPRTIDFESPMAFASIRQAQARYTTKLSDSVTWSVAVEDNKSAIVIPSNLSGKAEYPSPDFVTRFRFDFPKGHFTTAAFLGAASFRPTEGDTDTVTLWGTVGSLKVTTVGKDYAYTILTYGDGIGRYRGSTTAVFDENGKLRAAGGLAWMGGYEHFWTDRWSTNAVYSVTDTRDESYYTTANNESITYSAVNLLYWFLGDRAWTGVEYIYGRREVFGTEGLNGSAHRLQYAVRFNLP